MNYNTNLQTNNTSLQGILNTVNNLTEGSEGSTPETWTFTMEDGNTKNETISIVKAYQVTYELDDGITSSNTNTFIRHGDTYETVLSSGSANSYKRFERVIVVSNSDAGIGTELWYTPIPDTNSPWLVHIYVEDVKWPLIIEADLSNEGAGEW